MIPDYDPNYVAQKAFALIGQKVVIYNEKGEVLLLLRSEKAGAGGKWALAGGGLELNEDPEVGIRREIEEETQLSVEKLQLLATRSYKNDDGEFVVIIGYSARVENPNVLLNWEHDDFRWVNKKQALQMDITETARFLLEQFVQQSSQLDTSLI